MKKSKRNGKEFSRVIMAFSLLVLMATMPMVAQSKDGYIGEEKAKLIALEHAGVNEADTLYIYCVLDNDMFGAEYDVEFWVGDAEYDYEINAKTGSIESYDYDAEYNYAQEKSHAVTPVQGDYIGEEAAKAIALQDANLTEKDVAFLRSEFDYDDGVAEYEVEWRIWFREYSYTIRAIDGVILERDLD